MRAVPRSRFVVFALIAVVGCAVDLVTKHWAFRALGMPNADIGIWVWPEVFGFTTSLNEGALFGFGQGKALLFAGMSVAAALGILYWLFVVGAARDWLLTIALACVTAGIAGNLYDRLGFPGLTWHINTPDHEPGEPVYAVRDWLNFKLIDWPIFNLADSLLVCGAGLLVWHAFRTGDRPRAEQAAASESSTPG